MGCVYILKNEAMPGLIKIGYTKETAEKRANELYTTGVPQRFEVVYELDALEPEQYAKLEGEIHKELAEYRVNLKREFFEYPADDAIRLLKKLHPSVIKESRRPRWLKWIPNLRGFHSRRKGNTENSSDDTDESDPDETNTTDTNIGGTFMHNGDGNGVKPILNGKPYHSTDSGFACAAAGRGIPEAVRAHIGVIVRNEELETASNHEQIQREIDLLRDNKNTLEESQQNYQEVIRQEEQDIATKEVKLAELRAKLDAPPEADSDPHIDALREGKKEQEGEIGLKKIERTALTVASKAPTLVELEATLSKPRWSPRQLSLAIFGTCILTGLFFFLYFFYGGVLQKAFAPGTGAQRLNQFFDFMAVPRAWNVDNPENFPNFPVILFPSVFLVFAYVTHFFFNRGMEIALKWWIGLGLAMFLTVVFDGIIAFKISENLYEARQFLSETATSTEDTLLKKWKGLDIAGIIFLGFVSSSLFGFGLYCNLQDWGEVRPLRRQIKAEKNERQIKLDELDTEIEVLENGINPLDTQIAAQIKAHRHPIQVDIDRTSTEKENKEKEVEALGKVTDRIQSEIEGHQTKIDELEASLKRPERNPIDLRKMEKHVKEFVTGWCRFVTQRETVSPDDLPRQIENIYAAAQQTLDDYKSTLDI